MKKINGRSNKNKELLREISPAVEKMKDEMIAFIQKLVRTPSLPAEEREVQEMIASRLTELNLIVDIISLNSEDIKSHPAFSDDGFPLARRLNVVGRWPGEKGGKGRSLILNGHADVVSPGPEEMWDESPWSGMVKKGRIFGRGSADMKSGLSAAIFAVCVLQQLGYKPVGDLLIQSVVGEETGGCGTLTNIIKGYRADAAIIMEPTKLNIYPLHSGALSFRIKIKGESVHACMKNRGVSAIEKFYVIFDAVNEFEKERHLNFCNPHTINNLQKLAKKTSFSLDPVDFETSPPVGGWNHRSLFEDPLNVAPINFGTLRSGDWHSTVPGELLVEGRYGVFPGETIEEAKQRFEECVNRAAQSDEWLKNNLPQVEWFEGQFEPAEIGVKEPIIETLSSCHEVVLQEEVKFCGATFGSDVRLFTNYANIPALLYGPGDVLAAHSVNESISIDEILAATKVLALTIVNWCGPTFFPDAAGGCKQKKSNE